MSAFENATKFFKACEAPEGWEGCKEYVADGATFSAQSEPLADVDTVEAYCEWMAGFGNITAPGATTRGRLPERWPYPEAGGYAGVRRVPDP